MKPHLQLKRRTAIMAGFGERSGRSLLAVTLAVTFGLASLAGAQQKVRPDLIGRVKAKAGGSLANATVFIYTAGPKTGTSTLCPSCYMDCRKKARTDEQGAFKIDALDPQLLFRILVVAKGYKPYFVTKVDPAEGSVSVELEAVASDRVKPDQSVRGKIVDVKGKPIHGAVVESHGIRKKNDIGTMWGSLPGVDPVAVTDEQGEFLLTAQDSFEALDLRVEARGFAKQTFIKIASDGRVHPLTLTEGAMVTGRVIWKGKPLAGVSVGMVSVDRSMEKYTGNFDVGTDAGGRFLFVNLPPSAAYFIYGVMGTLKPYGAIPVRRIQAGGDGATLDVGDLVVEPGQRLAGQVVLADGTAIPAKTRLLISRREAWDSMQLQLDKDGRFDTAGIPKEAVSLSARVAGYRVSARNGSLDRLNPFHLIGRVSQDITNLVFLLEKGKDQRPDLGMNLPESAWPQNRPLRGAEGFSEHSDQWTLAGQVRDRQTKKPVGIFRVTPGSFNGPFRSPFWDRRSRADGTNGSFLVYLDKRFGQPALKVEAEGYLPGSFTVLPESRSNLVFTLEKGAGPSGTVLLPDGKPAGGANLALLCKGDQNVRLAAEGQLRSFRDKSLIHGAKPDGSFSFRPELEMERVVVAAKQGFKMVTLPELARNSKLVLEPWGRLKGVLHRASAPGTNETLDLAFQGKNDYFLGIHTKTDAEGRFEFELVPPGKLQINGRQMMSANSWQREPLEQVTLKPGQTIEISIQAPARSEARNAPGFMPTPKAAKPLRKTGPDLQGVVLLPHGKPASRAEVALSVTGKYLGLGRGALKAYETRQEGLLVQSDSAGRFSLPSVEGATSVVVAHPQGYARVALEKFKQSPTIRLEAWGEIEGIVHIGRRLGTNELVTLQQTDFFGGEPAYDPSEFQARTDDQGRFIMRFVPPGERKIARMIPTGSGSWTHAPAVPVHVKPGEVTHFNMGGSGRNVVGKIRLSQAPPELNWNHSQAGLHTPLPANFPKSSNPKEAQAWTQSEEGKAYRKSARHYPVVVAGDGSFSAEEVLPGKYRLWVNLLVNKQGFAPMAPPLGRCEIDVIIPDPRSKDDDSAVNLGVLEGKLELPPARPSKERAPSQ